VVGSSGVRHGRVPLQTTGDPEVYPGQRAAIRISLESNSPAPVDYARSWWEKVEQAYHARSGNHGQGCSLCGLRSLQRAQ
jgi:hypothetical protein